jgi:hypothetical protein
MTATEHIGQSVQVEPRPNNGSPQVRVMCNLAHKESL